MTEKIHEHYEQLTEDERTFVDDAMEEIFALQKTNHNNRSPNYVSPPLANDDRAERATDAIAKWVIGSRKL